MKLRIVCCCGALLAVSAGQALAAGNYERTKDGRVIVWNGDPKPGDTAQWFGGRDKDGYATGMGTLVWYAGNGELYASYHGKMARGKLDGPVDSRSAGKLAHAVFVNGERTTRWAAGSASKSAVALAQRGSPAPSAALASQASRVTRPSGGSPDEINQSAATKPETVREQAATAKSSPIAERQRIATAEKKEQTPNIEQRSKSDIPAEGPKIDKEKQTSDAESIEPKPLPQPTRPTITIQDKPEVADFSGPPSELREDSGAESSPGDTAPEVASSPTGAQLTPQEAMELADAEARARGYDLGGYEQPKADYSAVKGQWSFFYNSKEDDAAGDKPTHFLVTVDDTTKSAEVAH